MSLATDITLIESCQRYTYTRDSIALFPPPRVFLKINYTKSTALNFMLPQAIVASCEASLPFVWRGKAITYLGVQLPADLNDLCSLKFVPLLKSIQGETESCYKPGLSWFGRVAAIKMMILPKILYLLQTIPICLSSSFFTSVHQHFSSVTWKGKLAHILLNRLALPKNKGCVGIPDITKYHWASHLMQLMDWNLYTYERLGIGGKEPLSNEFGTSSLEWVGGAVWA